MKRLIIVCIAFVGLALAALQTSTLAVELKDPIRLAESGWTANS